jgi:hypothetical protein
MTCFKRRRMLEWGGSGGWRLLLCLFACLVRGWKLVDVGPPKDDWVVGCLPLEGIIKVKAGGMQQAVCPAVQHKGTRPGETCLWSFVLSYFHAHTYLGFIFSTHGLLHSSASHDLPQWHQLSQNCVPSATEDDKVSSG